MKGDNPKAPEKRHSGRPVVEYGPLADKAPNNLNGLKRLGSVGPGVRKGFDK